MIQFYKVASVVLLTVHQQVEQMLFLKWQKRVPVRE